MPTKTLPNYRSSADPWVRADRIQVVFDELRFQLAKSYSDVGKGLSVEDGLLVYLLTEGVDPGYQPQPYNSSLWRLSNIQPYSLCDPQVITEINFEYVESELVRGKYVPIYSLTCPPIVFPSVTGYIKYYAIFNPVINYTLLVNMVKLDVNDHEVILRGVSPGSPLRLLTLYWDYTVGVP